LEARGFQVLVSDGPTRQTINRFTYEELVKGRFTPEARKAFQSAVAGLAEQGAEAVLLACTEFPILLKGARCALPTYDSSVLHCEAAMDYAVELRP
jgi:aspartate racemase